ncbi:MAG: hypothetical protein F6J90_42325, partial [Moorea sp. SIOASIH]|nr:hypothetical protein [Moorena sp. SIOASIH]
LLPAPCSLLPAPCSLLPAPCSLLPAPCSLKTRNLYLTSRRIAIDKDIKPILAIAVITKTLIFNFNLYGF